MSLSQPRRRRFNRRSLCPLYNALGAEKARTACRRQCGGWRESTTLTLTR